jgi:preprotein translocase SecF subunit
LTVVGYSVNDTIVIYDRIRENLGSHPGRDLSRNVTISLNETLIRSINTSLVTMLSLLGILISGSAGIWDFAVAMAVGVLSATFSSTFVSSSSVVWTENFRKWWNDRQGAKVVAATTK